MSRSRRNKRPKIDDDFDPMEIMEKMAEAFDESYPFALAIGIPVRECPDGTTEFTPEIYYSEVVDLKAMIGAMITLIPTAEDFDDVKRLIQEVSYGDGPGESDVPEEPE